MDPQTTYIDLVPERFRCKCINNHLRIIEVPVRQMTYTYRGQFIYKQYYDARRNDWTLNPPVISCPECGCSMDPRPHLVRAIKTEKPCGPECICAKGDKCECSCGGANHGSKWYLRLSISEVQQG